MTIASIPLRRVYQRYSKGGVAVDSAALIVTSALTAATGLIFWALAARMLPPAVLGVDTAMLSLILTTGMLSAVGTGNSFTALLPIPGCAVRQRVADGLKMVAVISLVLGAIAGVAAAATLHFSVLVSVAWAMVGTLIMALFTVKDSAMVGLGGANRLPLQNLAASALKLALFPLFALSVFHPAVVTTLASAAVATLAVTMVVIPRVLRAKEPVSAGTDTFAEYVGPSRRDMAIFSLRDGLASGLSFGVMLSLPFVTTVVAGPVEGAVLAIALSISQMIDLISAGVGSALTAGLSATPGRTWQRARKAWLVTSMVAVLAAIGIVAISPLIVAMLGPQYRHQPVIAVLVILVVGSAVRSGFAMWASVLRSQGRTTVLLKVNVIAVAIALPAIIWCADTWGAIGSAAGLTAASSLLGLAGAVALSTSKGDS